MVFFRKSLWLLTGMALAASVAGAETLPNWTVTWTNDAHTAGTAANDQNALVLRIFRTTAHGGFGLGVGISGQKKLGAGVVSAGDPAVAAPLDMRGVITGLDYNADPATNAVWKFSHLQAYCFCPNDGVKIDGNNCTLLPAQWITDLRTPGTLAGDGWTGVFHVDTAPNPKRVKSVIVDEPDFTGSIGGWGLNAAGDFTNLVFRTPKAQSMVDPVAHSCSGIRADLNEWDLSGMKYVGSTTATASPSWGPLSQMDRRNMKGTLRLPSLVHIASKFDSQGAAFYNLGITSAELGLNGTLERLGSGSINSCASLTNVVIGAAPSGKTLTIATNAINCVNLKTVYFNGDKPTFAGVSTAIAFGTTSTAEGQITFYVRDLPSWADVLAEADANGGWVAATTLHTAKRQKVARFPGFFKTTVELQDPRFADRYHETVTMTKSGCEVGDYLSGKITLTATCSDPDDAATDPRRSKFLRWDGVPVELERQNPLTYTPVASKTVRAVFAHDWIMSDVAEPGRTMENGIWRICCYKWSATEHRVGIGKSDSVKGKGAAWPLTKDERIGGGDLNLNGDVWYKEGDTWQKWTIVVCCPLSVWTYAASGWTNPTVGKVKEEGEYDKLPTRVTFPESLLWWPGELQNYDSWDSATTPWPVEEIFAICPEATGTISAFTIGGVSKLSRVVIRAPKVATLGSGGIFGLTWCGSYCSGTDFSEWDLTGVTTVKENAFRCAYDFQATGTLNLPNVQTIGTNAFYSTRRMTGLVLGTNGLTLTKIDDTALATQTVLTDLAIGTKNLTLGSKLGATSVFALPKLKNLSFPGPALPTETVDAILSKVAASDTEKQTTIYASLLNGWDKLADAPTDAEAAVAPASARYGVYRRDSRKAWLVHAPSEYDPHATILIFR